ncbi:hypothetical protein LR48_Vigan11g045700 [Vigna angularis]|uniref:Uncharacterized protein n=1 Tax=Phaseolus angularis TaxID=3914 RepID=A0A0L9VRP2_PHAAN|nr:hypothetical protein LR48_Vigan11g045700 [Vigna angularis]
MQYAARNCGKTIGIRWEPPHFWLERATYTGFTFPAHLREQHREKRIPAAAPATTVQELSRPAPEMGEATSNISNLPNVTIHVVVSV